MQRRTLMLGACAAAIAAPSIVRAQAQPKVTIAVGGKNLLYYLPLTIAETQGFFKDEGLDFT
ncbi:MAG: ABC transporter substrate-binding protein, partial [Burkholderiaceae bacterium]|nr:ABC transporter substrate-binding protein [Burkholderiaceae bacterium]